MKLMSSSPIRAPLSTVLPSFAPVILERGIPGYEADPLAEGELRIQRDELKALLIASAYIGALNHALKHEFKYESAAETLAASMLQIRDISEDERRLAADLVERFRSYRVIREDHSLDDWVSEALWPAFQRTPYVYPSAMSGAVAYGLSIDETLQKCVLEEAEVDIIKTDKLEEADPQQILALLRSNESLTDEQVRSFLIGAFERISALEHDREELGKAFRWLHENIANPPRDHEP